MFDGVCRAATDFTGSVKGVNNKFDHQHTKTWEVLFQKQPVLKSNLTLVYFW